VAGAYFLHQRAVSPARRPAVRIDKPDSAKATAYRDLLLIQLRDAWTVGGRRYPAGALLAANFDKYLAGERALTVLFTPSERKALAGFSPTRHHIVINELDNVRNRVVVLSRAGGAWKRAPLRGLPELSTAAVAAVDADESDEYFATVTGFLQPSALYLGTAGAGLPVKLKQLPAFFDATGLEVSQHDAVSKDGTRIPYFQVGRPSLPRRQQSDGAVRLRRIRGRGVAALQREPRRGMARGLAGCTSSRTSAVAANSGPRWHQAALRAIDTRRMRISSPSRGSHRAQSNYDAALGRHGR
jgi:prolyl oligopeptidase